MADSSRSWDSSSSCSTSVKGMFIIKSLYKELPRTLCRLTLHLIDHIQWKICLNKCVQKKPLWILGVEKFLLVPLKYSFLILPMTLTKTFLIQQIRQQTSGNTRVEGILVFISSVGGYQVQF